MILKITNHIYQQYLFSTKRHKMLIEEIWYIEIVGSAYYNDVKFAIA